MASHVLRPLALGVAVVALLTAGCSPEPSSEPVAEAADAATQVADAVGEEASSAVIQPEAIAALEQMSAHLRTLNSLEMKADTLTDVVLTDGQKIQFGGDVIYRIRRPDAFVVVDNTDRKARSFYYDGKTFTLFAPRMNVYAQAPVPPTIAEVLDVVDEKYGIQFPLENLFHWGTEKADTDSITSALFIGYARVGETDTLQYAYRQADLDWQVFLKAGDRPLPVKIVLTSQADEAKPQYVAVLDWKENPPFSDATFAFKPSASSLPIKLSSN